MFRVSRNTILDLESEDDISVVDSDYESDEGPFTFRRKPGVQYLAPLQPDLENEPWRIENLEQGEEKDRFIWTHIPGICVSYSR